MKKTLLIAVAALAVGITSIQAQSVYSQNVVGYVNTTLTGGGAFNMITAPLGAGTNAVEQLMPCLQSGDIIYLWQNGNYYSSTFIGPGSGPGGEAWLDQYSNWTNSPTVLAGQGFFYSTASGNQETNTFTGTVIVTNSTFLPGGGAFTAVASTPPISGYLDSTNFNLPLQSGDIIYLWVTAQNAYYSSTYIGPGSGPGGEAWLDQYSNWTNAPYVNVGQGFFYSTASGSAGTWNQSLKLP